MNRLTVVVGMIVVMTANVDVEDGLTNGATGVVKYTDYRMERTNRPSIIWVLFDDPRIGISANSSIKKKNIYTELQTYQRPQFPLRPASGKTVYKAECATVDKVVVDLSQDK